MGLLIAATATAISGRLDLRPLDLILVPHPEAGNQSLIRTSPVDVDTHNEYHAQYEPQTEEEPFCEV
jgi:hypothetical protein